MSYILTSSLREMNIFGDMKIYGYFFLEGGGGGGGGGVTTKLDYI